MKKHIIQFEVLLSGTSTGALEAVYIKLRQGKVHRTEELCEDLLLCDYGANDELIGIEILGPVKMSRIVKQVDPLLRKPFQKFVLHSVPKDLVTV